MTVTITPAVQKAIYAHLTTGGRLSCSLYDYVPQGASCPYVTFDSSVSAPIDPLNGRRDERFEYMSIWSTYRGQKEVKQIIDEISTALHNTKLALDSGTMILCRVDRTRTVREPDGMTYMGSLTLRILTDH